MFYIRVDGNDKIATGHVMRCLAIANALRNLGEETTFILAEKFAIEMIEKEGFKTICLNGSYDKITQETDKLIHVIKERNIKILLVDSYFVNESYFLELKKYLTLIYIDDIGKCVYPVDLLINYCNYYEKFNYQELYSGTNTKLLLGCDYVPLREEFSERKQRKFNKCRDILITTGGTDAYNMAYRISKEMLNRNSFAKMNLHIISGKFNFHLKDLKQLEELSCITAQDKKHCTITIYNNVKNMADMMMSCDLGISAGGTTLYELCYCGLPTVCFAFADNQLYGTTTFGEENILINTGDIRQNIDDSVYKIVHATSLLMDNIDLRMHYSKKMTELVDGNGALRIAKEIINIRKDCVSYEKNLHSVWKTKYK